MRRSVERDCVKVSNMTDLVRPLGTCVLTGHDVPTQINCDGVRAVHSTFLTEGLDRPPPLDRGVEFVDALPETEGVRILNQRLEYRPRQAVQFCGLKPPRPDGSRGVINVHHALEPHEDVRSDLFSEPGLQRPEIMVPPRQHCVEASPPRPLGQQSFNPSLLFRIVERIGPPQMLAGPVMRDRDGDVMRDNEVELLAVKERPIRDDREGCFWEAFCQRRDRGEDVGLNGQPQRFSYQPTWALAPMMATERLLPKRNAEG